MYERRHVPPISLRAFVQRLLRHGGISALLIGASLVLGMAGFRVTEGYAWMDAYLNAAMLLGGMGQVAPINTPAGKLFAGSYALFSGLVVIVVTGLLLAPVVHRILHVHHWDADDRPTGRKGAKR